MSTVEAILNTSSPPQPSLGPCEAARGLYERNSSRILGFCLRRLNTREEAEDAVQSTFVNALRALQRGVVPVSEQAWLFKIAENVCLETHRTNKRRRLREVSEPEELADPVVRDHETGRELIAALAGLPTNQRRALLLREWQGLSYREIAAEMRLSVGAVETLIFRARRNAAQAMSRGEPTARSRVAGILDFGSLLSTLKTALGGATAAKVAAAAAVVTVATLPVGDSPRAPENRQSLAAPEQRQSLAAPEHRLAAPAMRRPGAERGKPSRRHSARAASTGRRPVRRGGDRTRAGRSHGAPARGPGIVVSAPAAGSSGVADSGSTGGAPTGPPPPLSITPPILPPVPPPPVPLPDPPAGIVPPDLPELPGLPLEPPNEIELPELPELP